MARHAGHGFLKKLADALGITGHVSKIVIEATLDEVVKVYVRGLLPSDKEDALAGALKLIAVEQVDVSDQADVIVTAKGDVW